jgi:hypothetical protein
LVCSQIRFQVVQKHSFELSYLVIDFQTKNYHVSGSFDEF